MNKAIFFDLDGTLLDTAQDFAFSINLLLQSKNRPTMNFDLFREHVYGESKKMISFAFNIEESHPEFAGIRDDFLQTYHQNCTVKTIFFDGILELLDMLDQNAIPWGIVTSKPTWLTLPVLKHFGLDTRAACIVMGDTLNTVKPDPAPLLYACERANILPEHAVYVGDLNTDILAAKSAGMKSIAVTYGYHPPQTSFAEWNADFIAHSVQDIVTWLNISIKK